MRFAVDGPNAVRGSIGCHEADPRGREGRGTVRPARLLSVIALALASGACAPSTTPAPVSAECEVEVWNESGAALSVTAFGRDKIELGQVDPGEQVRFTELCRVERVSVRGGFVDGPSDRDPLWVVAVMRPGGVTRVALRS